LLDHGVPLHRRVKSCDHGDAGCSCPFTTNKFALQEFASDFPVIAALQQYRTAGKFLSTYLNPMDERDVVHPSFWPVGAWTGRMSCTRPNLQNIPVRGEGSGELREMFVPRPGHCFVVSDYDQIELRLLAHYLHSDSFKEKIERGDDVFAELAASSAPSRPATARASPATRSELTRRTPPTPSATARAAGASPTCSASRPARR
jgi:DNA polymerase I-like protein with 3'-5' exonuclease and polymerase domains